MRRSRLPHGVNSVTGAAPVEALRSLRSRGVQVERPKTGAKPDARPAGRSPGLVFQRGGAFAWTGEVNSNGDNVNARIVNLDNGNDDWNNVDNDNPAAVCLRP